MLRVTRRVFIPVAVALALVWLDTDKAVVNVATVDAQFDAVNIADALTLGVSLKEETAEAENDADAVNGLTLGAPDGLSRNEADSGVTDAETDGSRTVDDKHALPSFDAVVMPDALNERVARGDALTLPVMDGDFETEVDGVPEFERTKGVTLLRKGDADIDSES